MLFHFMMPACFSVDNMSGPRCKEEDQRYKARGEKLKMSLPFHLKTDI
jgi:hypothetical protein